MSDKTKMKGVMTLAELQQTPEYADCSDKMKLWLGTLFENGFDYVAATAAAFTCKDPQAFSSSVRQWPAVRAVLNVYRGLSAFDIWMEDVQRASRSRRTTTAQIQALKMQADAMGWNAEGPDARLRQATAPARPKPSSDAGLREAESVGGPAAPKRFKVGDRVVEKDDQGVVHVGIVTKVDDAGQILDGEEVFE